MNTIKLTFLSIILAVSLGYMSKSHALTRILPSENVAIKFCSQGGIDCDWIEKLGRNQYRVVYNTGGSSKSNGNPTSPDRVRDPYGGLP